MSRSRRYFRQFMAAHANFDVEPGMSIWSDAPEEYKRAYEKMKGKGANRKKRNQKKDNKFLRDQELYKKRQEEEALRKGVELDDKGRIPEPEPEPPPPPKPDNVYNNITHLDQVRYYMPLVKPNIEKTDVVLHIPIQLNDRGKARPARRKSDFEALIWTLRQFRDESTGTWRGELVISINGFIGKDNTQDLKFLDNRVQGHTWGPFHCTIFQRVNYGYQWGGFYDVWCKYKDLECSFYGTLECDCYLKDGWFEKCQSMFQNNPNFGYIGMAPDKDVRRPLKKQYHMVDRLWEKHDGSQKHSRGGFYLCKRELLEKIDEIFGHFTYSMASKNAIDGIACGEIGFPSKTRVAGFSYGVLEPGLTFPQP